MSITGTQNSLADALLEACVRDLALYLKGSRNVAACRSLTELRSRSRAGNVIAAAEVVLRIYDTGPIADPGSLPELPQTLGGAALRREPPAGPWSGVVALRVPALAPGRH